MAPKREPICEARRRLPRCRCKTAGCRAGWRVSAESPEEGTYGRYAPVLPPECPAIRRDAHQEREFVGGGADARIKGFLPHLEGLLSCQKPLQSKPPLHPPLWFRLPTTKPSSATRFASSRTKASGRTSRRWTRRVSSSPSSLNNFFSWV